MAIVFNDNLDIRSPKHIDARSIVGSDTKLIYANKEDIPESYRYESMEVYDDDTQESWMLVGGITDAYWTQQTKGSSILVFETVANTQEVALGHSNFDSIFTLLFANGVFINPSNYTISGSSLTFGWTLETNTELYIVGFTATIAGSGGSGSDLYKEEFVVTTDGETEFTLTNVLKDTSIVSVNGIIQASTSYTGQNTTTLTLLDSLSQYDTVIITGNI